MDLTDAMLDGAMARIAAHGWSNVKLVKSDAAVYAFPSAVNGILSTLALTLVPEFDEVVRKGAVTAPTNSFSTAISNRSVIVPSSLSPPT